MRIARTSAVIVAGLVLALLPTVANACGCDDTATEGGDGSDCSSDWEWDWNWDGDGDGGWGSCGAACTSQGGSDTSVISLPAIPEVTVPVTVSPEVATPPTGAAPAVPVATTPAFAG